MHYFKFHDNYNGVSCGEVFLIIVIGIIGLIALSFFAGLLGLSKVARFLLDNKIIMWLLVAVISYLLASKHTKGKHILGKINFWINHEFHNKWIAFIIYFIIIYILLHWIIIWLIMFGAINGTNDIF